MKLEIKHLVPYLPYGLKMLIDFPACEEIGELKALGLHPYNGYGEERITVFLNTSKERGRQIILHKNPKNPLVKPLLIPLSEFNFPIGYESLTLKKEDLYDWSYDSMQNLFKNHYDVFGLIDAGLALNKLEHGQAK